MNRLIKINGLNCASCADKIETGINDIPWIEEASLNFSMGNINVKLLDERKYSLKSLQKVVSNIEDGVTLLDTESQVKENFFKENIPLIKLLLSLPLFISGLILDGNIQIILLGTSYVVAGYNVLFRAIKNILKGKLFDEFFLMSIATVGAFIIDEVAEGVGVMIFFQLGEFFQGLAVGKTKKSIKSLLSIKPDFARNNIGEKVQPETIIPGDIIEVRPGEKIPLDGVIISGETTVDTKTITGEPIPRSLKISDEVLSGFINISGVINVEVKKAFKDSTVSKILDMVRNESSKKTETENFISKFSKYYTPVVVIAALLTAIITRDIYKALIFLVISCPCALVISVPLGYFGGIGKASKEGILIKGSIYLEILTKITKFAFDKTGTLTKGLFSVTKVYTTPGITEEDLLKAAYKIEHRSNHPIAVAITSYCNKEAIITPNEYREVGGHGIEAIYPSEILLGGKKEFLESKGIKVIDDNSHGTKVYISQNSIHLGTITLSDTIKNDSIKLVKGLGAENIYMLTGDNNEAASDIAKQLNITNVRHSLLPIDKAVFIKDLSKTEKILFVGDGINDAPVLVASDVGISMGGIGSDAAIEASDIVILTDEPSKVISAIKIAKYTKKVIIQNIVIALGFKLIIMAMGLLGLAGLWLAIFADVGVSLIAVLNSLRTLNYKID